MQLINESIEVIFTFDNRKSTKIRSSISRKCTMKISLLLRRSIVDTVAYEPKERKGDKISALYGSRFSAKDFKCFKFYN